jgi:cytoskeletal protein RodZ
MPRAKSVISAGCELNINRFVFDVVTSKKHSHPKIISKVKMADSLGEKLRQAREARGYTIREVADQTRISVRHLEGIEADDYSSLPGGVFNKGFVKSYARFVGIDEKEALADYTRLMIAQGTEEPREDAPIMRRSEVYTGDHNPRSPWLTIIFALIILGLLSWGVISAVQWYQNRGAQIAATASPTPTPANTTPTPTATPTPTPSGLNVQLKAAEEVYIAPFIDGKPQPPFTLKANDTRDFTAQQSFKVQYSTYRAKGLQMTVNGQPIKVETKPNKGSTVIMEITPGNLSQFLQGNQPNAQSSPQTAQ